MIKINTATAGKVTRSNKDFFLYTLNDANEVIKYTLTNDLARHKKEYQHFRVVSTIIKQLEFITI